MERGKLNINTGLFKKLIFPTVALKELLLMAGSKGGDKPRARWTRCQERISLACCEVYGTLACSATSNEPGQSFRVQHSIRTIHYTVVTFFLYLYHISKNYKYILNSRKLIYFKFKNIVHLKNVHAV